MEETTTTHKPHRFGRAVVPLGLLGGIAASYPLVIRPWHRRWGATAEEVAAPMPGDDIVADANYHTTRAITIAAPPALVWPWLAQMGQGRGGLYSYDWLENLAGFDIHSLEHIDPALQNLKPGDIIPLSPDGKGYTVEAVEPGQALVLAVRQPEFPTTWVWTLHAVDSTHTRMVVRWRARYDFRTSLGEQTAHDLRSAPWRTLAGLGIARFLDLGEFVMERGMLHGIKERAEGLAQDEAEAEEILGLAPQPV